MYWCCDQSNDSDGEINIERVEEESINCKPKKKNGISDLDIREWSIELRENDLRLEEQNVMKKEITMERRCLEKTNSIKRAKDALNIREIEIEEELRTLTEKKQDILTYKLNEPIILKLSFDFKENIEISYKVYEDTKKEKKLGKMNEQSINKNSQLMDDHGMRLNEDERKGLGETLCLQDSNHQIFKQNTFRDCSGADGAV